MSIGKKIIIGISIVLILAVLFFLGSFIVGQIAYESDMKTSVTNEQTKQIKGNKEEEKGEKELGLAVKEAEQKGLLLLVNKENPLEPNYRPEDLAPIKYYAEDRTPGARFMRQEAAEHFHGMVEAAEKNGISVVMTTAYRDYDFQKTLYDNYVSNEGQAEADKFSAKPGQSEHQTGLAVDVTSASVGYALTYEFGQSQEGKWLAEHAHEFGFILRFPEDKREITGYNYEPWHFRYVGQDIAREIYKEKITLEEFIDRMED